MDPPPHDANATPHEDAEADVTDTVAPPRDVPPARVEAYDDAVAWCNRVTHSREDVLFDPRAFLDAMTRASRAFGYPFESLDSLLRHVHLEYVKKRIHRVRATVRTYLDAYCLRGRSVLSLSREANYPPYMTARIIVEHVCVNKKKKALTEAMRDPRGKLTLACLKPEYVHSESLGGGSSSSSSERHRTASDAGDDDDPGTDTVLTTRLAREVMEAIRSDPLYGPRHDEQRGAIGVRHEVVLEETLTAMNIPFETEADLRVRGTARTPDVLLSYPVGIEVPVRGGDKNDRGATSHVWRMVCWIDSKAMFGDVHTHHAEVIPQAEAFVHRFGPGLIVYWYGHAPVERLSDGYGDVSVTGWEVPDRVMLPNGKIVRRPERDGGSALPETGRRVL